MVTSKESLNEQIKSFNARCRVLGIINNIFNGCESLEFTKIPSGMFASCYCGNGIKLHEGIDTIGGSAFQCY